MSHGKNASQRWLVSYADMVTLLFALFLVLFAVASVDNTRLLQLAIALDQRLKLEQPPESVPSNFPTPAMEPERLNPRTASLNRLASSLSGYDIERTDEGLNISLTSDGILFDSGEATLKKDSAEVLSELAEVLKDPAFAVKIEGHTDSQPISTPRYHSNWELSLLRAWAVAEYFRDRGADPERLSVMGFAHTRPVASNNTPEGRAQNRRVVIAFILRSVVPEEPTIDSVEENSQVYGPRISTSDGSRSISVGVTNSPCPHTAGAWADDIGPNNLLHPHNCCLGPYQTGPGDSQYPTQHRADTVGPVSDGALYGSHP